MERKPHHFAGIGKNILIATALASQLISCKTRYVAVPAASHRDSVRTVWRTDSVWQRDSVFVAVERRADTVFLEKTVTKYRNRDRILRDTVQVTRRDTVPVPCPVETAARRAAWYDIPCRWLSAAALLALLALLVRRRMK